MQYIFELMINLIEAVIETQFYVRHFGCKSKNKKWLVYVMTALIHFVLVSGINYVTYLSNYTEWIILLSWIVIAILLLNGNIYEKVFIAMLHNSLLCIISIMLFSVFDKIITYSHSGYMEFGVTRICLVIIAKLSELIILEVILRLKISDSGLVGTDTYKIMVSIVIITDVAQSFLRSIIYQEAYDNNLTDEAKLVSVALFLIDIMIYIMCMKLTESNINLMKVQMKNLAYENRIRDIESANIMNRQIMKINHDIKTELLSIRLKLHDGRIEDAENYIDNVLNVKLVSNAVDYCNNVLVDSIINRSREKCKEKGISLQLDIECKIESKHEMDMAVLLSNLLDNAIEAAQHSEQKKIYFKLKKRKNYVDVNVKNTYNGVILKGEKGLVTTKEDKINHGYGLMNVNEIVERYDGMYEVTYNSEEYETIIMLYLK